MNDRRKALILGKIVLVTGAARQLGGRFVRRIQRDPGVDRVIALDAVTPGHQLGDAEFVLADIRQSAIARILAEHSVDTVVHLDVSAKASGAGGRTTVKETNVIGTMQLLGACQKSPAVQRLVVKSSTNVYGSAPRDPAVFTETTPPKSLPSGGFAKDTVEVEGYVRGFARRRPDVAVCVLRFANILGPEPDSPLADYLTLPVLPTVLGYDPRLQFVHEDDVVDVLEIAAREPRRGTLNSGTFNIAGDGVLLLSQCSRRPGTADRAGAAAGRHLGGDGAPYDRDDGLLAGTDPAAHPRQGRLDGADARDARVPAQVHHGRDLRGVRAEPGAGTAASRAGGQGGRETRRAPARRGAGRHDTFDSRRQVEERDRRWRTPRSFPSTTTVRAPARRGAEACRRAAAGGRWLPVLRP